MSRWRPKITLPQALAALLWFAACPASWLVWRLEGQNFHQHWLMPFALPLGFLMFSRPIAGVGTLLGRPGIGILLGLLVYWPILLWIIYA